MKVVQTKTAAATPASKNTPFFNKEGAQDFFHANTAERSFFTGKTTPVIQAKLTVGKPNDPYEREADTMADKVVQRLAEPSPMVQKKEAMPVKSAGSLLQAKCSECEQEEKLQKKEIPKQAPEKIQRKAIFESNEDKGVQRKALPAPSIMKKQDAKASSLIQAKCSECEQEEKLQKKETVEQPKEKVQLKPLPEVKKAQPVTECAPVTITPVKNITPVTPAAIQAKCNSCEQEEQVQEKEEEADKGVQLKIQKKPIFESNAEPEETVQRKCRECEEGNEVFLKPEGMLQRAVGEEEFVGGGSREAIVAAARGELGKVRAKEDDGTGKRVGSERLLEYFHVAAPDVWDDSIIETHGAKMPSWCGIFSVWAHKKAGRDIGNWEMGKGVSAFGTLTNTDSPEPGDIGYIDQPFQHHCIVERVEGDTIHTIDGNSGLSSEVIENTRARSEFSGFMTAFGGAASTPVQGKEEDAQGLVQTKSGDTTASPSVEQQLSASKGKGQSLPESTRTGMEQGFGADFSNVKVHTDSSAVQMSKSLHAQAFTHGSDVYFNSGKYDTGSSGGQRLLAHELTHVIQQGSAPSQTINRSVVPGETPASPEGEDAEMTPESIEESIRQDMANDDLGGTAEPETEDDPGTASAPAPAPETGGDDAETGEPEEASEPEEAEEAEEEPVPGEEDSEQDSVPDNTPAEGGGQSECPNIIPEYPEVPAGPLPEEEDTSFYEDLMQIAGSSAIGGSALVITRIVGGAAFRLWRALPVAIRIRVINFVLDKAISGFYMGRILGRYSDMGGGLISAALLGFFKQLRAMPDVQKLRMFEKFGRIILRGDIGFMLGMMKGLLMGFFLDGLLGIVQMVIDIICIVPKILDFFRTIQNFLSQLPYEVELIKNSIEEMMASVGDVLGNAMSEIMDMLRNPQRVAEIIDRVYEAGVQAAERAGKAMADALIRFASLPAAALGEIAGRIGGQLLFEAVLAYFTSGGGAAITSAKLALRAIGKSMAVLGRQIFRVVRALGRILRFIKRIINSVIRFLTPLLQRVARLARRVVDRLSALFKSFSRHCRPGSIKCKLPKPKCKGRYVSRLGGFLPHDRYVRRVTGTTRDYRLTGSVFGLPVPCNYDAKKMPRRLIEGKTGYRYLPFIERTRPSLFRAVMFKFNEQRWRCMAIAARCGYTYTWYMQNGPPAAFLNARWHGMPPVLHVP